jgi:hypothetical protein
LGICWWPCFGRKSFESLFENCKVCRGGEKQPLLANGNKTNRKSFREKGRLALLLLPYRPLRVCSVVAPSHPTFLAKTANLGLFKQALKVALCIQLIGYSLGCLSVQSP